MLYVKLEEMYVEPLITKRPCICSLISRSPFYVSRSPLRRKRISILGQSSSNLRRRRYAGPCLVPFTQCAGTFKLKSGAVDVNLGDGSADGLIEVDATSGESGNPARDARMHKSILESDRYPIISFRPTHVIGEVSLSGDEVVTVEGAFRIHGAEHPLQLRIHIYPKGNAITLKTQFTVPYVDWGMKDPSIFVLRVNKTVDIEIEATASANE
jgi:polyisoprenoid-binding protein YceI